MPTAQTLTVMSDFYDNLWSKKLSRVEALRQAQLKMLREGAPEVAKKLNRPELAKEHLPPYFWAAFVLAGDWR